MSDYRSDDYAAEQAAFPSSPRLFHVAVEILACVGIPLLTLLAIAVFFDRMFNGGTDIKVPW